MDNKGKYTRNTRISECSEYMQKSKFLSATQRAELQAIIRCPSEEYGVGRRANAILLLDDGLSYAAVAQVLYLDDGPVGKRSLSQKRYIFPQRNQSTKNYQRCKTSVFRHPHDDKCAAGTNITITAGLMN